MGMKGNRGGTMGELSNTEHIFENILQGITDPILILSRDFKIIWVNEAFQNQTGFKIEDIISNHCYKITHRQDVPCQPPHDLCPVLVAEKTGNSTITTHIHFDSKGNKIFVQASAYPMRDKEGEITKFVCMYKDITDQKKTEEMLRKTLSNSEQLAHDLAERVKELNCLYSISLLVDKSDLSFEELLQGIINIVTPAWQYPRITCARITVENLEFKTENFKETIWKQVADLVVFGERVGAVEVYYLEKKPDCNEGPFLKEERSLLNAIAERVGKIIRRQRMEEALKRALEESQKKQAEILALLEGSQAILKYHDFKSAAKAIFDSCKKLIGATSGYIALLRKDGLENEVLFLDPGGLPCTVDPRLSMPVRGLRGEAYQNVKTVYHNDFSRSEWMQFMPDGHVKLKNVLFAPMIVEGKAVGLLGIANKPEGFSENDAQMATAFAELATIALTQKHAEEELRKAHDELEIRVKERTKEIERVNEELQAEVSERTQAEGHISATNELLKLFVNKTSRKEYLDSVVELIRNWSGCHYVGIRVLDAYGNIPFESYIGFIQEFWESENWISLHKHQCACVRVMLQTLEPQDLLATTPAGSFRCDNTDTFFRALSEKDRGRFRGICFQSGFTSLAIIAIRFKEKVIGTVHLADKREGMVPLRTVEFVESITPLIGEAVQRFSTEEELTRYQYHLEDLVDERTAMLKAATEKLQQEVSERKMAAEEVLRTKTYLETILNNSMDLIITVKKDGTIGYVNPQSEIITGYQKEKIKGRHFLDFVPEHLREPMLQKWDKINKGIASKFETEIIKADGTIMYCLVSQSLVEGFDEFLVGIKDITERKKMEEALLKSHDALEMRVKERTVELEKVNIELINEIEERKRIEKALRQSEARLSEAQRIARLGNWDWNIQTNQLYWSDEIYCIFGLNPQQFGATYEAFLNSVHPEDRKIVEKAVDDALLVNKPYSIDHRIVLPDGTVRIVHEQAEVTFNDASKPIRMIGTVQDITDYKKAEEELKSSYEQLRKLSAHLQSVREEERTSIAREIHDELGQVLTALKIDVSILSSKIGSDSELLKRTESIVKKIDDTIQSVKKICTELRPTILDHFGLSAAIEWQAEEFGRQTGIQCDVFLEPKEIILDQDLSIAVFRVFQEALTNVARHANATGVKVNLILKDGKIILTVTDNGKGMTEKQFSDPKSFGILGIKERVDYHSGDVTINGVKNKGTTLTVSIPLGNKEGQ